MASAAAHDSSSRALSSDSPAIEDLPVEFGVTTLAELVAAAGESIPLPHSRVVLQGDSTAGRVDVICMLHLRMRHMKEDFADMYVGQLIAEYQASIWRLLEQKRPDIILLEGFASHEPYPRNEKDEAYLLKLFPDGRAPQAGKLTDDQVDILAIFPSAIVAYRLHHPHVELLGADSDSALKVLAGHDHSDLPELRYTTRERQFMSEAARATADHPGKEVVLIVGAAHRLDRAARPAGMRMPTLVVSAFPALLLWDPDMMVMMTARLSRNAELQEKYIRNVPCITSEVFEQLSAKLQIYAIANKQFLLHGEVDSRSRLQSLLTEHAQGDDVRAELRKKRVAIYAESLLTPEAQK